MAKIIINIPEEEKLTVIKAVKKLQKKIVAVSKIATEAKLNPNRVRFIIEDLLEEKRIERHIAKQFNGKYVRYYYTVKE